MKSSYNRIMTWQTKKFGIGQIRCLISQSLQFPGRGGTSNPKIAGQFLCINIFVFFGKVGGGEGFWPNQNFEDDFKYLFAHQLV